MLKFIFITLFTLFLPVITEAQIEYKLTTPIPGLAGGSQTDLGSYIATLFQFGLAIVGLVAFGSIIFHGVKYIAGGANASYVQDAKEGIWQAIYGVILLLAAVTILDTINPCIIQTVNFWRDREALKQECQSGSLPKPDQPYGDELSSRINQASDHISTQETNDGRLVLGFYSRDGQAMEMIVYTDGLYEINSYSGNTETPVRKNNKPNSVLNETYDFLDNETKAKVRQKVIDFIGLPGPNEDQPLPLP